jgi:hypothetical protein
MPDIKDQNPKALAFQATAEKRKKDAITRCFISHCFTFPNCSEKSFEEKEKELTEIGLEFSCLEAYTEELANEAVREHFLKNKGLIEAFIKQAIIKTADSEWKKFKSSINKDLYKILAEKIFFQFESITTKKTKENDPSLSTSLKKIIRRKLTELVKSSINKNPSYKDLFEKKTEVDMSSINKENVSFKETLFSSDTAKLIERMNDYSTTQRTENSSKKVRFASQKSPLLANSIFPQPLRSILRHKQLATHLPTP